MSEEPEMIYSRFVDRDVHLAIIATMSGEAGKYRDASRKLAAREKRMREVAEELKRMQRVQDGVNERSIARMRYDFDAMAAKLLEGIKAE